MPFAVRFSDVVDSADSLSVEEQQELVDILKNRMRERKRQQIIEDVEFSREEYRQGKCQPMSPEDILKEALS